MRRRGRAARQDILGKGIKKPVAKKGDDECATGGTDRGVDRFSDRVVEEFRRRVMVEALGHRADAFRRGALRVGEEASKPRAFKASAYASNCASLLRFNHAENSSTVTLSSSSASPRTVICISPPLRRVPASTHAVNSDTALDTRRVSSTIAPARLTTVSTT